MMAVRKVAAFLVLISVLASAAGAQTKNETAAEKEKQLRELHKEMLERTIAEVGALRLPQNRAVVYALAGDILWTTDSKRSRELFRSGAGELNNYQAEAERERLAALNPNEPPADADSPRFDFINLVGNRDAELALEIMQQTRTPGLADAMVRLEQQRAAAPGAPPMPLTPSGSLDQVRAAQEISLEEQLKMRAAMNDPEKTVKAIRESLAKGISPNVTSLLQQLIQKDEKLANDLSGEVVNKLTGTDLSKSQPDLNGALSILQFMGRTPPAANPNVKIKYFSFTPAQSREAAYAVANAFLQPAPPAFINSQLGRAIPILEKLAPEKAMLMKQRDALNKKNAPAPAARPGTAAARPFDPNGTPEEILAAAAKITNPRDKANAYQAAASRIPTITDETRARRLAESIPDERLRAQALERLDTLRLGRLTAEGNLEEARRQVAAMPNAQAKLRWLVNLAVQFRAKGTEKDIETATGLMNEARTFTTPYPEDEDQLGDYMELIRGFAAVEPETAFRMFEPVVTEFDDIVQASATLSKFNKRDRTFRKGELVMRINGGGSLLPFRYVSQIQSLARADLEKMSVIVDRFRRSDARTIMRLYVLQGFQRRAFAPTPPPRPAE
jgi:hypothetical protein